MLTGLPIASDWFSAIRISPTIDLYLEHHVHELLRASIWHVRGADRDLVVDTGLGIVSLRDHLPQLFVHDPVLVVTHAHIDHMGSAWEFDDVRAHAEEPIVDPPRVSLQGAGRPGLDSSDFPDLPPWLLNAIPSAGFAPEHYRVRSATVVRVGNGETIDLGDRQLTVIHLPGHTHGSVALLNSRDGEIFTGDVIYDDVLVDSLPESDVASYRTSMTLLRTLPIVTVYPGHGMPFSGTRMCEIIAAYLKD